MPEAGEEQESNRGPDASPQFANKCASRRLIQGPARPQRLLYSNLQRSGHQAAVTPSGVGQ